MSTQPAEALVLRLERFVRADPARVWAAWTEPEQLAKWSAPAGLTIPEGELELRVGGRWRVRMLEPDGTAHEAFGRYLEIAPPERLVYTHAWHHAGGPATPETVLTVEFRAAEGGTRVVLTQEGFASPAGRDGHEFGWNSSLDRLVELLGTD